MRKASTDGVFVVGRYGHAAPCLQLGFNVPVLLGHARQGVRAQGQPHRRLGGVSQLEQRLRSLPGSSGCRWLAEAMATRMAPTLAASSPISPRGHRHRATAQLPGRAAGGAGAVGALAGTSHHGTLRPVRLLRPARAPAAAGASVHRLRSGAAAGGRPPLSRGRHRGSLLPGLKFPQASTPQISFVGTPGVHENLQHCSRSKF